MPPTDPTNRLPTWEWLRTALLATNLVWTTLCLGGYLPGTRVDMIALTGLLVAVHFADPGRGTRAHPAGWLFLPFLAYAAANVAWVSPVPWLGWTDWLNWAQGIAVFWVVLNGIEAPACRRALAIVILLLGVTAAAMAAYQHFVRPTWLMLGRTQAQQFVGRSTGPFGIPNSLGVFMALLIPPVGALVFGRGRAAAVRSLAALALLALTVGFALAISRGAWLALAAAFALRPLFSPGDSLPRRLGAAGLALLAVAAAAVALYLSFPLMRERVHELVVDVGEKTRPIMWRGAWRLFRSHPVLGVGGGGFDPLFERYRPEGYRDQPVYAHCDYLNTLCDYGLVGFGLFFGAAALVAWRGRRATGLAGAAATGLLAFALHLLVDFHLKIPALAMLVATVAAGVTASAWPAGGVGPPRPAGRALALAALVGSLAVVFLWAVPKYEAEEMRRAAREQIDHLAADGTDVSKAGDRVAAIQAALHRSTALDPRNAQSWSDAAYADSLAALVRPADTVDLGREVTAEAGRATALSPVVAEFWIRKGTGLDMQRKWVEGGDCFVTALQLAPMRADVWYYEAYHDSLASTEAGPAIAAANTSLRLDPGFLLAQLLRQRLETR
jgi:O-antigen ligase